MKTLQQTVSLKGQVEQISISEFRNKPGEVFAQVHLGKSFTITKNGKPIAQIVPTDNFDWESFKILRSINKS